MSKLALIMGLTAPLTLLSCTAIGADQQEGEMVSVWSVDRTGAPPFKRELIQVPAADIAALELNAGPVETEVARVVNFRGSPPFKRKTAEVPVIDAASIETEVVDKRNIRPRNFFKRIR
ncbi:MAG: hypothetical protein MI746_02550 [Pseudomonadales bacterium]|nr:hypothetical protein [Pseudomonadales bacterium]